MHEIFVPFFLCFKTQSGYIFQHLTILLIYVIRYYHNNALIAMLFVDLYYLFLKVRVETQEESKRLANEGSRPTRARELKRFGLIPVRLYRRRAPRGRVS